MVVSQLFAASCNETTSHAKKLNLVASQRSEELRAEFIGDCSLYSVDMLVVLDESGCDKRHAMRKFGYALKDYSRMITLICFRSACKRCQTVLSRKTSLFKCHDDCRQSPRRSLYYWQCG